MQKRSGASFLFAFFLFMGFAFGAPNQKDVQWVSADCENLLEPSLRAQNPKARLIFSRKFLQEHMIFGAEVTFTNEILNDIPETDNQQINISKPKNISYENAKAMAELLPLDLMSADKSLKETQVKEILRFITSTFDVEKAEIVLIPTTMNYEYAALSLYRLLQFPEVKWLYDKEDPLKYKFVLDGYVFHAQNINIFLKIKNHPQGIVMLTIEPGCVEVHFKPEKIHGLENLWAPIFKKALAAGFKGYIGYMGGGGAGHMHLGFDKFQNNVFLHRLDVLKLFIMLPLVYPSLIYFLHEFGDAGFASNIVTPLDFNEKSKEFLAFQEFLKKLSEIYESVNLLDPNADKTKIVEFFLMEKKKGNPVFEHTSYMSLKNFQLPNPSVEVRFQRSFNSMDDLMAVAHLWQSSLDVILNAFPEEFSLDKAFLFSRSPSLKLLSQFEKWIQLLGHFGFPQQYENAIKNYGGDQLMAPLPLKGAEGIFKGSFILQEPTDFGLKPRYTLFVPDSSALDGIEKVKFHQKENKSEHPAVFAEIQGRSYLVIPLYIISIFTHPHIGIEILDENGKSLQEFYVNYEVTKTVDDHLFFEFDLTGMPREVDLKREEIFIKKKQINHYPTGKPTHLTINGFVQRDYEVAEAEEGYFISLPKSSFIKAVFSTDNKLNSIIGLHYDKNQHHYNRVIIAVISNQEKPWFKNVEPALLQIYCKPDFLGDFDPVLFSEVVSFFLEGKFSEVKEKPRVAADFVSTYMKRCVYFPEK